MKELSPFKSWTDQPDEVESAEILSQFTVKGLHGTVTIEMRKGRFSFDASPRYYVTAGNLFGSQTVLCDSADVAFKVLGNISGGVETLPDGAQLL